jgi:hypothetical protein
MKSLIGSHKLRLRIPGLVLSSGRSSGSNTVKGDTLAGWSFHRLVHYPSPPPWNRRWTCLADSEGVFRVWYLGGGSGFDLSRLKTIGAH